MHASAHQAPVGERPRRSDARRNIGAIVDAALELLATNPRASMQDVAEVAGVHRATVHRHFATRDDLVRAVRERSLDELQALTENPDITGGPPAQALERLTRAALELGDRQRTYRVTASVDDASEARQEQLLGPVVALMTRAQAAGVLRKDLPASMLASAWGGLTLSGLAQMARGLSLDDATRFVLTLLRAPR